MEELRATSKGVRRIEERQTQTDARMTRFEDKLTDIEAGNRAIGKMHAKM